ncbi:MAG: UTP--glucose-1-phosphate uridylyltransferase [Devosiaceae bacterium]|nr:UTP--glucose-1-phosphate uridylyltransferase [Devosiaceae bacterium]
MTKIRKAIIPIGYFGTGFLPATKAFSNEMLTVVDRPLIQYAIDEARKAGIEEFIFVTGGNKSVVENYLTHSFALENFLKKQGKSKLARKIQTDLPPQEKTTFIHQQSKSGVANAILCARNIIGNEPFALLLPEILIQSQTPCLTQLIKAQKNIDDGFACAFAVQEVAAHQISQHYNIAHKQSENNIYEVTKIFGKTSKDKSQSNLAMIARYIFSPAIFDIIAEQKSNAKSEPDLIKAMQKLLAIKPILATKITGTVFDCQTKAGFIAANLSFAIERSDIKEELIEEFIRTRLRLRIDNMIEENAIIEMTRVLKATANK